MKNLTTTQLKKVCDCNAKNGMGIRVKVFDPDEFLDSIALTNGRFLICGHQAYNLIEKFNKSFKDILINDVNSLTADENNGRVLTANTFEKSDQKFPDFEQVIPMNDRERVKAKLTNITLEFIDKNGRVLIGEDKSISIIDNDYLNMLETIGVNLDQAKITLAGREFSGRSAVCLNFEDRKIIESNDMILLMPIRLAPDQIENLHNELNIILNTTDDQKAEHDQIKSDLHDVPDTKEDIEQATSEEDHTTDPSIEKIAREIIKYDPVHKKQIDKIEKSFQAEPVAEVIEQPIESDNKIIDVNDAKNLYHKIKDRKAYISYHFTHDLLDILINNNVDMIDTLNNIPEEPNNPATFRQTRALQRVVFGMHYNRETLDKLVEVL